MDFLQFLNKYEKKKVIEHPNKVSSAPLVSIMVQSFQHRNYICDCLENILYQKTDFPFEILLGEDNSTDGTREICMEYAKKHPEKIRFFQHHYENKIQVLNSTTGNFNALYNFYSARGKFIAFCEGDDLWMDPLKLKKQVEALRANSNLSFTYHSYTEVNSKKELLPKEYVLEQPAQDISKEDLRKLTFHPLLSTMCFRKFGNELPEQMAAVINVDSFLISLLGNYGGAGFLDNIKPSFYRRHEGGIWSAEKKEFKIKSKLNTYKKLFFYYKNLSVNENSLIFLKRCREMHKRLIYYYVGNGKLISALHTFYRYIRLFNFKSILKSLSL